MEMPKVLQELGLGLGALGATGAASCAGNIWVTQRQSRWGRGSEKGNKACVRVLNAAESEWVGAVGREEVAWTLGWG